MANYGTIGVRGVIYDNDKLLVVSNNWVPGYFVLPGGGMNPGESVTEALKREIVEELGVIPEIGDLLAVHQIRQTDGNHTAPGFIYHITNPGDFAEIDISKTSHGEEEIDEFLFTDDFKKLLPQEIIPLIYKLKEDSVAPAEFIISDEIDASKLPKLSDT